MFESGEIAFDRVMRKSIYITLFDFLSGTRSRNDSFCSIEDKDDSSESERPSQCYLQMMQSSRVMTALKAVFGGS